MQIDIQLSSQQQLGLKLTPAMKQSIDLLQMHAADLVSYLQDIADENPIIEIQSKPAFDAYGSVSRRSASFAGGEEPYDPISGAGCREETLEMHLIRQLRLSGYPRDIVQAAAFLAGNLNEDGYLEIDLIQASTLADRPVGLMMKALNLLQSMDPPGVGARSLGECLILQIERDGDAPAFSKRIVQSHFQDLAAGRIGLIAKKLKTSPASAERAANYIRSLNPRPGLGASRVSLPRVVPDAEVIAIGNRVVITVFDGHLPRIRIDRNYELLLRRASDEEAASYLREKIRQAHAVINGLKQRKTTLLRVVEAIYERQKDYFRYGNAGLRPLSLRDIAAQLELHESTISRTVQNKFLQTSHGVVSLKSFFSGGLSDLEGRQLSSQKAVMQRIKELIDGERKTAPYSDSRLAELLQAEGLQISRRTVAKYREELRILSSVLRKSRS